MQAAPVAHKQMELLKNISNNHKTKKGKERKAINYNQDLEGDRNATALCACKKDEIYSVCPQVALSPKDLSKMLDAMYKKRPSINTETFQGHLV